MKNLLLILFTLLCCSQSAPAENYPYRLDHLWLTVPDHADWLYRTGEKAKVEISFCLYGIPQDVEVTYEIGPDMMPATSSGKVMLKRGRATIDMGTMKKPGFLDLRLTAKVGDKKYQHHVKVGFSPEQLKPYTKNPSDFDAFWQSNLEAARKAVKLADGVIDTTNHETAGLKPAKDVKTVTIFRAGDDTDHYSNGVVMTSFKGKLYCMWQSSPKDEDSDDTWVAYSVSADDGQTWSKPQPLALPTKDCYCTSGGWLVRGDTLIAFIDTWQKGLDPRGGKTNYMTSTDGYTWSQMQAVTMADGSVMEGVLEQDPYTLPGGRIVGAAHFMAGLHICPVYTDDPKGIAGWRKALFESEDMGKQSREIEPSQYVQPDGTLVMLFRDQRSSFRKLVSVSSDRGETWTKPALTNIPDGRTKQCAGNLPNGTSFMVSCPANEKRRWPLVLQLSLDGSTFDKAVLLRSGSVNDLPPKRYEGRYKTVGYNYPKAMVWQDKLFVCYSTNKEDVECTVIPLNMKLNY